ncbi:taste receptor type 1 member 1 isoform X2 [Denticeps clupeoides]|uniref:G-protein coupled receptors family 3 profile domain-containing protein n=1 Tax=Denticeps clupeoides TaxID=299321 RepID=A0AAY4DGS4_9TELE|nr:taste receptor type 1 member 1-like isoform X2 [Denticeps clupeoides]
MRGVSNPHGYNLVQAMRFAVEEINNNSRGGGLLPGVTLGYHLYDTCSQPASILATVKLLADLYNQQQTGSEAVALIGPDSSSYAFTPASALGAYLMPLVSYEATNELLSNRYLYPSFFRTIPSDKNQVMAMLQMLRQFNWTWIALLGSNDPYGQQGVRSLSVESSNYGICIAYQGIIPTYSTDTQQSMRDIVSNIVKTKVNTIVVFSGKRKVKGFMPFVIEANITGKVWIGTEDWSVATLVSGIPKISTIGTVVGVSVKYSKLFGFRDFEQQSVWKLQHSKGSDPTGNVSCLDNTDLYTMASMNYPLENYDTTSSVNVYKAVYAVAHALHLALGCHTGQCQKTHVQPWQLQNKMQDVRFSIRNWSVYFDANGNPPTGYDIVTWIWNNNQWSLRVVGSYSPNPPNLYVDPSKIQWWTGGVVPTSVCSPNCPFGYMQLQTGQHKCCFDCMPCPASTFLNKTGSTNCQLCEQREWSPPQSEWCLDRTVLYLPWVHPMSAALLMLLVFTLVSTLSTALVFLLHLNTPVVKSAGGKTCLVMLLALTAAAGSTLCHFGIPTPLGCLLKQSLFVFSFTVCLSCVAVRSFQVVCIFKWAAKLPRYYETWSKNKGPELVILLISATEFFISLLRVLLDPPFPSEDFDFYQDSIVEECSRTLSPGAFVELIYVITLSILCFCLSYMGKDLPANYSEAKCITFSLMIYMISWITFFTIYSIQRNTYVMAMYVTAILLSVLGILGGYFLPKMYIIVVKPQMNTASHFQNCIQMYTMTKQ